MKEKEKHLQAILDKTVDGKKIFGTSFGIKKGDSIWTGASGNLTLDQPYFIASTTKLFTTAIILHLISLKKLQLSDKIEKYLSENIMKDLHFLKGTEYSHQLTIESLLAHTSGLPDYFQGKGKDNQSLENKIKKGQDQAWTFEESIEISKTMKPHFKPDAINKAHYSDTNFQLLGKIIENTSGKSFAENCDEIIIKPLTLTNTYLYQDITDERPQALYYKTNLLHIPKAMTSFGSDGSIVSTTNDLLTFIEAFFVGKLFPKAYLTQLQKWNKIFFPMKAGVGIQMFKLPWIMNPTGAIPPFIGHSGLSGTVAYYIQKENMFIVGTVNQVAHPDISFKTMIKLTQCTLRK